MRAPEAPRDIMPADNWPSDTPTAHEIRALAAAQRHKLETWQELVDALEEARDRINVLELALDAKDREIARLSRIIEAQDARLEAAGLPREEDD